MKFFEGVRNYQNWNETIKKECIEKLKEKARNIELQLTLKRGFLASKISEIYCNLKHRNLSSLFQNDREERAKEKFSRTVTKLYLSCEKKAFDQIASSSQHFKASQ